MANPRGSPRRGVAIGLGSTLIGLALIGLACSSPSAPSECSDASLLSSNTRVDSYGVVREDRLVDGRVPTARVLPQDFVAALSLSKRAQITFDLGAATRISTVWLLSNDKGPGVLSWSTDGKAFSAIGLSRSPAAGRRWEGFGAREATSLDITARYLRLEPTGRWAYAELQAFCAPPPELPWKLQETSGLAEALAGAKSRRRFVEAGKAALPLVLIPPFVALLRLRRRRRLQAWGAGFLIAVGALGWVRFGEFRGGSQVVQQWDALHYYIGAKYFQELGYFELYRCIARYELSRGRAGALVHARVRDLDDYLLYPASWIKTREGRCRATFSDERWEAFGRDLDEIRRGFTYNHLQQTLADHGYNATPLQTALLVPLVSGTTPRHSTLLALSLVDVLTYAVGMASLWWAFGPPAAALAAVLLGLGEAWGYQWAGGGIARGVWVGVLCAGMALLAKRRFAGGAALVTVSGMLRLFPLMFVAALGCHALVGLARSSDRRRAGRILAGIGAALALGVALGGLVNGFGVYRDFVQNMRVHSASGGPNHLGAGVIASYGFDPRWGGEPSDPTSTESEVRLPVWRLAAWAGMALLAIALLASHIRKGGDAWAVIPLAGPLLFCLTPMAGYDYAWMVVLAPLAATSELRTTCVLLFLSSINLAALYGFREMGVLYSVMSALLVAFLLAFSASLVVSPPALCRDTEGQRGPPA